MKVLAVSVACLVVIGCVIAYTQIKSPPMKVARSGMDYNAFKDADGIWVLDHYNGSREQTKSSSNPKLAHSVTVYEQKLKTMEREGDIAKLTQGDEVELIDFYCADQSRFKYSLVPYTNGHWSPELHYYCHVRVKTGKDKGKVFFMKPWDIAEPRPKIPGEPG